MLYNPTGEGGHGGGGVAAPVASNILTEALPYFEIVKDNITEEDIKKDVEVPNFIGLTYKEAKKLAKECGLNLICRNQENEYQEEYLIQNQVPGKGVKIVEGGGIVIE